LWFLNWLLTKTIVTSLVFASISCIFLFAFRVYETEYLESINEQIARIFVALIFSNAVKYILYPVFDESLTFNYVFIHIFFGTVCVALANYIFKNGVKPKKYIVIGRREEIGPILNEVTQKTHGEYQFVEYINPSPEKIEQLIPTVDGILIADYELYNSTKNTIKQTHQLVYLPQIIEKTLKRIPLEVIEKFKNYYETEFSQAKESPAKRVLDIFCGITGLIIFSPVMLITAIWILIEDGRPVIFKQHRIGKDNKPFVMHKFRTMKKEKTGQAKFADQEADRILKVGKFIRPFRIDESLQFVNILKGDMSIVGPRPEQIAFVKDFEQKVPYYSYRHTLKPGLTGWAQIMYKYSSNLEEVKTKLSYDLYYIKNRTIFMDLRIILQTIETVIWRRGAK
jgi:exopolysaccharide biosynthesis polyprenyl glycosylphosphotransferase